jgi:hypothetical protein
MDDSILFSVTNVILCSLRLNFVVFIVTLCSYKKFSYPQVDGPGTVHLTGTILEVRFAGEFSPERHCGH